MQTVVGLLNVLMTVAFLLSVLVQYNDPDAIAWMLVYGASAAVCIAFTMRRMRAVYAFGVASIALIWALFLVPSFWGSVGFGELFESFDMKTGEVERARELGGLIIVVMWMGILGTYQRVASRRATPAGDA